MILSLEDVYTQLKNPDVRMSTRFKYSSDKTNNKVKTMSLGRIWFNLILPDDYTLIDEPVTRSLTNEIMLKILNKDGPEKAAEILGLLNNEAFKIQTIEPVTFSVSDFILPDNIQKMKDDMLIGETDPVVFQEKLLVIADEYLIYLKDHNSGLYDIVVSGAKGSPIDIAVLLIAKGASTDFDGNLTIPTPNSINDGFTLDEFYENSVSARSNLFIRSVGSAIPGDVSRITAFANSNILISDTVDCGTKRTLNIEIDKQLASRLTGRYHLIRNRPKLIEDNADIVGSRIKLRSPLYCIEPNGICLTCYGDGSKKKDVKTIGLLASSIIGVKVLNAFSMKSRHMSSAVKVKSVNLIKDLIK